MTHPGEPLEEAVDEAVSYGSTFKRLQQPLPVPQPVGFARAASAGAQLETYVLGRIVEPIFQLVCQLNRMKRLREGRARLDADAVRTKFIGCFDNVASKADREGCLTQFEEMREFLYCFVDIVMKKGDFMFSDSWISLSSTTDPGLLIASTAAEIEQRRGGPRELSKLVVAHTSLCLCYDLLDRNKGDFTTLNLLTRIDEALMGAEDAPFCPDAYKGVFTHSIIPPVHRRLRLMVAASAVLVLLSIGLAVLLNYHYYQDYQKSVQSVRNSLNSAVEYGKAP